MMRWIVIAAVAMSLQGCALFGWRSEQPIKIEKKAADRTPLNLPMPAPLRPSSPQWIVITPENAERVWAELKKRNVDLVLFALTDDGYEELSIDAANIRDFIATQREIIIKYREYYEPQGEKK